MEGIFFSTTMGHGKSRMDQGNSQPFPINISLTVGTPGYQFEIDRRLLMTRIKRFSKLQVNQISLPEETVGAIHMLTRWLHNNLPSPAQMNDTLLRDSIDLFLTANKWKEEELKAAVWNLMLAYLRHGPDPEVRNTSLRAGYDHTVAKPGCARHSLRYLFVHAGVELVQGGHMPKGFESLSLAGYPFGEDHFRWLRVWNQLVNGREDPNDKVTKAVKGLCFGEMVMPYNLMLRRQNAVYDGREWPGQKKDREDAWRMYKRMLGVVDPSDSWWEGRHL